MLIPLARFQHHSLEIRSQPNLSGRGQCWTLDYTNGAGKEYVILRNFKGGTDDLDLTPQYGSSAWTYGLDVAVGVARQQRSLAALGQTVAAQLTQRRTFTEDMTLRQCLPIKAIHGWSVMVMAMRRGMMAR